MRTEINDQELRHVNVTIAEMPTDRDLPLIELAIVLAKRKWMILGVTLICGVVSLVYSLLLPKTYTAETKILPPQQTQSVAAAMLGQLGSLGSLAGLAGKDLGIHNPNDIYVAMLQSRTVSDALIRTFALKDIYKVERMMDARRRLAEATDIDRGKNGGLISISVQDHDPKRAADIANAYVHELHKLTQTLAVTEAAQRRVFFEKQLRLASENLARAEQDMQRTQETTGLIQLDDQAKATINAIATARGKIAAKEVQIQALKTFATEQNPALILAQDELRMLKAQLAALEINSKDPVGDLQLPSARIPSAGVEYVRRLRDVKYYEAVFELLSKQYEIAKLDEAKNAAMIQVLDPAVPPEWKSKPKRAVIVLIGLIMGLFAGITIALLGKAKQSLGTQPYLSERLSLLKHYLLAKPGKP